MPQKTQDESTKIPLLPANFNLSCVWLSSEKSLLTIRWWQLILFNNEKWDRISRFLIWTVGPKHVVVSMLVAAWLRFLIFVCSVWIFFPFLPYADLPRAKEYISYLVLLLFKHYLRTVNSSVPFSHVCKRAGRQGLSHEYTIRVAEWWGVRDPVSAFSGLEGPSRHTMLLSSMTVTFSEGAHVL